MTPHPTPTQLRIPLVLARGGTSKGLYLHARDLPGPGDARDRLLCRLMGSPDVLQVDGLGGSRPITSKIAIVGPTDRPDADVDYTFAQVDPATGGIGYRGNCGNISAGVGPFAIDEGLVPVTEGETTVRIHNTNTGKVLVARVPVDGGRAAVEGDFVVPGVPGSGAEIAMDWKATIGAVTGRLLPTGRPVDTVDLEDGRRIGVSLVDAGNPCAWAHGRDLGIDGTESAARINADPGLRVALDEVRGKAAVLFGLADDWRKADDQSPGLPMLGLVSPPTGYTSINGLPVTAPEMDVRLHLIFLGVLHESVAGTGSVCFAAASRIPGTVVNAVAQHTDGEVLRVGHASGVTPTRVRARAVEEAPHVVFDELGFSRTARRLMDGHAYYPASLLAGGA